MNQLPLNLKYQIAEAAARTRAGRENMSGALRLSNNTGSHQLALLKIIMGMRPTPNQIAQLKVQHENAIKHLSNAMKYSMQVHNAQHGRGNVGKQYMNERKNQLIRILNNYVRNYPGALTANKLSELTGLSKSDAKIYLEPINAARQRAKLRSMNAAKRRVGLNPRT